MTLRSAAAPSRLIFRRRNRKTLSGASYVAPSGSTRVGRWKQSVDWSAVRFRLVAALFVFMFIGLWVRAGWVQLIDGPALAERARRQHISAERVDTPRGMIFDRAGNVLARSVECRSVYANPSLIKDFTGTATVLAEILNLDAKRVFAALERGKQFAWIARRVDDATAEAVRRAALPGVDLIDEYERIYPYKQVAGQLLGFVGVDGKGLEGVEHAFNEQLVGLAGRKVTQRDARGRRYDTTHDPLPEADNIQLTLDLQVQFMAEDVLARTVEKIQAKWGGAIIVDVPSGDVLAWAQYPFFNPNAYRSYPAIRYRNHLALDALEPGSTFKPLVVAAGLQEKVITPETVFNCENGVWRTRTITFRDDGRSYGDLPVHRILALSSNIGAAKIGQELGSARLHRYLSELGFGQRTGLNIAESKGILRAPREWSESDLFSTSFGQSIAVTAAQMAQAYLTLANNGVYKPLNIVLTGEQRLQGGGQRVFAQSVSRQVLSMMREVVEDGTGKNAAIPGVSVAGKTGTAQKADKTGTYGAARLASFVGMAPAENPQYLVIIMLDEPDKNKYGGAVAAPIFREVLSRMLAYYGALPDAGKLTPKEIAALEKKQREQERRKQRNNKNATAPVTGEVRRDLVDEPRSATVRGQVPDVIGKSVRSAVELFARQGLVPQIKGEGTLVVRQEPAAGTSLQANEEGVVCTLWLSEN